MMAKQFHTDNFKETVKGKLPETPDYSEDHSHIWAKVEKEINPVSQDVYTSNYLWYAAAAVLIFLSAGMVFYFTRDYTDTFLFANNSVQEYSLADGSKVTLNKYAKVVVDHDYNDERLVGLKGEAYFEVNSNPENPFVVEFDNYRLVVLGTKFNIRNAIGENEVTVTEGVVKVYAEDNKEGFTLHSGDQLVISSSDKPELSKVDAESFISWKTGLYNFKDTPLEDVTSLLSRRYEREIVLNPLLKNCTFTGDLTTAEFDEAIKILAMSTFLKIETSEDHIYLTGPACD